MRHLLLLLIILGANSTFAEGFRPSQECELNLRGDSIGALMELALKERYVSPDQVSAWLQRGGEGLPWAASGLGAVEWRMKSAIEREKAKADWLKVFPTISQRLNGVLVQNFDQNQLRSKAQIQTAEVQPVAELTVEAGEIHSPLWFRRSDGWTLVFGGLKPTSGVVKSSSSDFTGLIKDVELPGALQALRISDSESVVTEYNSVNKIEVSRMLEGEIVQSVPMRTAIFHVPMALGQTASGRLLSARIADNTKTGALMIIADITDPQAPQQSFIPLGSLKVRGLKFVNDSQGRTFLFSPERVYRYVSSSEGEVQMQALSAPDFEQIPFEVTDIKVQVLPDDSFVVARQGRRSLVVDRLWPDGQVEHLLSEESHLGSMSLHRDGHGRVFLAHAGTDQIRIFEPLVRPQPILEVERERPLSSQTQRPGKEYWHKAKWVNLPDGEAVFTASSESEADLRIYTPDVLHPIFRIPFALSAAPGWNATEDGHLYLAVPRPNGRLSIFDLWFQLAQ